MLLEPADFDTQTIRDSVAFFIRNAHTFQLAV